MKRLTDLKVNVPGWGHPRFRDSQAAISAVVSHVLNEGSVSPATASQSIGAGRPAVEIRNLGFTLTEPRRRLPSIADHWFSLGLAVARFLWMMSGSDRLADIEPYSRGARRFSDDGLTVPGSNFGARLIRPRPGLNQLANIIELLQKDPNTRRALAAIYLPEDCGRNSRDIPCVIALNHRVIQNQVYATTIMRSNNAWQLLPFNLFEFSLLAEVVAAQIGLGLGHVDHIALSMHIFQDEVAEATAYLAGTRESACVPEMPPVPASPPPLKQIRQLIFLEIETRSKLLCLTRRGVEDLIAKANANLAPFWEQLYYSLLLFVLWRVESPLTSTVLPHVLPPWDAFVLDSSAPPRQEE